MKHIRVHHREVEEVDEGIGNQFGDIFRPFQILGHRVEHGNRKHITDGIQREEAPSLDHNAAFLPVVEAPTLVRQK